MKDFFKKIKTLGSYYMFFFLTVFLIITVILFNKNTNPNLDVDTIKSLPWNHRSTYIKQMELISRLKNKKSYDERDLIYIDNLINLSLLLKDEKTLNYAQSIKLDFLLRSLKNLTSISSSFDYISNLDFNEKLAILILNENAKLLNYLLENSTQEERAQLMSILKILYPDRFNKGE